MKKKSSIRLEKLFKKLGYSSENGLYLLSDVSEWRHKFPYRISRVLEDVIKPYAFFCSFQEKQDYSYKLSSFVLSELQINNTPTEISESLNKIINQTFNTEKELEKKLTEILDKEQASKWSKTIFQNLEVVYLHPNPLNPPFILFFDKPDDELYEQIPKLSFSFGQTPIVVISEDDYKPVKFFHGYDFDRTDRHWLKSIVVNELDFHISKLATGKTWKNLYERYFRNAEKVDKKLLRNIVDARRILIAKDVGNLNPKTANRLIGRLLFVRYLIDRDVRFKEYINGKNKKERQKSFLSLLQNHKELYLFFEYLTEKYNGDLFPIKEDVNGETIYDEIEIVKPYHLTVLYHLFNCSDFFETGKIKGYTVQQSLFNLYDFEVIPIELISNIYENFIGDNEISNLENEQGILKSKQKEIKAYYTPPFLVDYVLSQSVGPFLNQQNEAKCRILDPACGSGIFLVESLRKLIEKELQINPQIDENGKQHIENKRLWELVENNIFGIDIDEDAIEITIFSLYITLLDYKTPVEIENFKFRPLKNINLFGGEKADFFNTEHIFNDKFKNPEYELDFIIGNPPWGKVKKSNYENYINERNKKERTELKIIIKNELSKKLRGEIRKRYTKLAISEREISQAFIIRTSDFLKADNKKKSILIVRGNNFYNTAEPSKTWRKYLLNRFHIKQVLELSSVSNKISGGHKVFEHAKYTGIVLSFSPAKQDEDTSHNLIRHISVRPNRFFNFFRTIVIQKQDVKEVRQSFLMQNKGGYDWLWKTLLHGSTLDFYFIKRLKENFKSLEIAMKENDIIYHGGLKFIDVSIPENKRKSTKHLKDWDYLEIENSKDFLPYRLHPSKTWEQKVEEKEKASTADRKRIYDNYDVARLPELYFFEKPKVLFKEGAEAADNFSLVSAFSEKRILLPTNVFSITKDETLTDTDTTLLKSIVGITNSKYGTFFLLHTGASLGVAQTRVKLNEFFKIPIISDKKIADLTDKIQDTYKKIHKPDSYDADWQKLKSDIVDYKKQVLSRVYEVYSITDKEQSLIDYAIDIAIPVLKREENKQEGRKDNIFAPLRKEYPIDENYLREYSKVFEKHFSKKYDGDGKYFIVEFHITSEFIGCKFEVSKMYQPPSEKERTKFIEDNNEEIEMINQVGNLGIHNLTSDLFIQQDIRGFNKGSFYVIKPNERKLWHKAVAYLDRSEFIKEIMEAEIRRKRK